MTSLVNASLILDAEPAELVDASPIAAAQPAELTKSQKKRAAKKRATDRKKAASLAEGAEEPRLDTETMSAMLAAAKASMSGIKTGEQNGEEQVKAAMQALSLVTGVLREQKGSEEGVLGVLKEARAKAETERARKEKGAANQIKCRMPAGDA